MKTLSPSEKALLGAIRSALKFGEIAPLATNDEVKEYILSTTDTTEKEFSTEAEGIFKKLDVDSLVGAVSKAEFLGLIP